MRWPGFRSGWSLRGSRDRRHADPRGDAAGRPGFRPDHPPVRKAEGPQIVPALLRVGQSGCIASRPLPARRRGAYGMAVKRHRMQRIGRIWRIASCLSQRPDRYQFFQRRTTQGWSGETELCLEPEPSAGSVESAESDSPDRPYRSGIPRNGSSWCPAGSRNRATVLESTTR